MMKLKPGQLVLVIADFVESRDFLGFMEAKNSFKLDGDIYKSTDIYWKLHEYCQKFCKPGSIVMYVGQEEYKPQPEYLSVSKVSLLANDKLIEFCCYDTKDLTDWFVPNPRHLIEAEENE
jgi:hypothetical protein